MPQEFNEMTPAEFTACAKGYFMHYEQQEKIAKANIYNLAALIRMAVWGKRMPKYEQVFNQQHRHRKMSDEEMYRTVLALNGKWGSGNNEG